MQTHSELKSLGASVVLGTALILVPVISGALLAPDTGAAAYAKGGNGGGNGHGGGSGGGHGGHGGNQADKDGTGKGPQGNGYGHGRHGHEPASAHHDYDHFKLQGSLNAAHSSATARAHAAAHSRVGLIATYEHAVLAADLSPEDADSIASLLSDLDDPNLSNRERHAIQAELAEIVARLEQGEDKDLTEADIDTLAAVALSSLEQASNKALDGEDKMIDAVNDLLGIEAADDNAVVSRVKELND